MLSDSVGMGGVGSRTVPAGAGLSRGAVGVGWAPAVDKSQAVEQTHSLPGAGAWCDGEREASGVVPRAAVLGNGQRATEEAETRGVMSAPCGMVAGLSLGTERAGGSCLVVPASELVGTRVVAEAGVGDAGSGWVAPGVCSLTMAEVKTAGDGVVMEALGISADDGGVAVEAFGSTAGEEVVMEVSGSTADDEVVTKAFGSTVGDEVVMKDLSTVVDDGVVIEVSGSTAGDGVVMEDFGTLAVDGVVVEFLGLLVVVGLVLKAFCSTAAGGMVTKTSDGLAGDRVVKAASIGMVGNTAEVTTGERVVGSVLMGKDANDSTVGAAVDTAPRDRNADVLCDGVELNGRVPGQIRCLSLSNVTSCPARWGGLLQKTWVDNLTFSLLPRIQRCR